MDGYTVEETAAVLGVPRERVWELLARGILGGSTDLGGGMRVRLKPEPAPAPPVPPRQAASSAEGSQESTPFRELLTEFRSLTERYGQALLALGEARGETAALRSRVEALEARVDLRLPTSAPVSAWDASPWPVALERPARPSHPEPAPSSERPPPEPHGADAPSPDSSEPSPVTLSATDELTEAAADAHEGSRPKKRRGRGGRRATAGFAEALARAEDPSVPELPGASEAAAALAALQADRAAIPAEPPQAVAAGPAPPLEERAAAETPYVSHAPSPPAAAAGEQDSVEEQPVEEPVATWDRSRYTTEIGEPEWLSVAQDADPDVTDGAEAAAAPEPAAEVSQPVTAPEPPDRLAEGLAALDAVASATASLDDVSEPPADTEADGPGTEAAPAPPVPEPQPFTIEEPPPAAPAPAAPPLVSRTGTSGNPLTATTWARPLPQRGPAVRAYRRLRRIFPA